MTQKYEIPVCKRPTAAEEMGFTMGDAFSTRMRCLLQSEELVRHELKRHYPSWNPDSLRSLIGKLARRAVNGKAGARAQILVKEGLRGLADPFLITVDFDGQCGMLVHPRFVRNAAEQELRKALRFLLGPDKVRVGQWGIE